MKTLAKLVESEVRPLSGGEVMHAEIEALSVEQRIEAYAVIQWMEKRLAERKKILNTRMKTDVESVGLLTEKGHRRFEHHGSVCTVEKRVAKIPDENELNMLVAMKSLDEKQVYDQQILKVANPSKINALVAVGKLTQEEADKLYKVTYALTVDPSEEITRVLTEAAHQFASEAEAVTGSPTAALPATTKKSKSKK